ncbi:MAG: SDR family oxidoreductase [Candidatus Omnitrophica bacterium]|nr:SDR family oxidoreductase [Candidatus Omnitrophota bacterium]
MKNILITGGSGLLGSNIVKIAVSKFNVHATYNSNKVSMKGASFLQADLADKQNISRIKNIKPDFIINCSALTNIDYCQEHPAEAYRNNVMLSINIAEAARDIGAYLIHISTDNVFDGQKGNYKEEDTTGPINIYGKTKLEAEREILSLYPQACIVRTNIYGWNKLGKLSLAEWMLGELRNSRKLPAFKDVYFSPILVNCLAGILFELEEKKYNGILHVAASQSCSKLDFAYALAEVFGINKNLINPVSVSAHNFKAPRPKNLSLDASKAEKILRHRLPNISEGLREMKALEENGYVGKLKNE